MAETAATGGGGVRSSQLCPGRLRRYRTRSGRLSASRFLLNGALDSAGVILRGRSSNMASVVPESRKIKTFRTEAAFESWMRKNHARENEVWLRIYKKCSGVSSITTTKTVPRAACDDARVGRPGRLTPVLDEGRRPRVVGRGVRIHAKAVRAMPG